jgi:catechol 2,3-dioxygenase-like lactoylglutathione lyase family enzyme
VTGNMTGRSVKGLDHVVVMVDGIDAAEAAYKKLGFQVQPRGFHTKLGTANHLMIFDRDYFEILGIVAPTEFNTERREWLKQGGGLANVALSTDGADLAYEAFKEAGLNPDAPLAFERAVEIDGKTEYAKFRTVRIPKTNMPVVGFFVCEHQTPQFVYRPEWAKHPNGARNILGMTVITEQPAKWTDELRKYFGPDSVRQEGDSIVANTGSHHIRYLTRQEYAQSYPGITPVRPGDHPALLRLRVDNLPACEALLKKNGVKILKPDAGRLLIPPSEAAHLTIEFAER